jgi:hypothetical protein
MYCILPGYDTALSSTWGPEQHSLYSNWLWAWRSRDRIPVGARFSAPIQTSPGAHTVSHPIGTGSFSGVKRLRRGTDQPPPSSDEDKERVELYLYSTSGPSWPVLGWTLHLTLPLLSSRLYQQIGGIYCLPSSWEKWPLWRCMQYIPLKEWCTPIKQHSALAQDITIMNQWMLPWIIRLLK